MAVVEAAGKPPMARKNQHSFSKRQREQKKAEKAAQKKARREALKDSPALPDVADEGYAPTEEPDVAVSE